MKLPMLTSTDGKQSASLTMAIIAFTLVSLWLAAFIIAPIFGLTTIPAFDGASAMLFLTPCLATYFGRRLTDSNSANS